MCVRLQSARGLPILPVVFKLVGISPSVEPARLRSLVGKMVSILSNLEGTDCL